MSVLMHIVENSLSRTPEVKKEKGRMVPREEIVKALTTFIERGLPEMLPEKVAEKKVQKAIAGLQYEGAPTVSPESDIANPEYISEIPNKATLDKKSEEEFKELINLLFGAKPRGRFTDEARQTWTERLLNERKNASSQKAVA